MSIIVTNIINTGYTSTVRLKDKFRQDEWRRRYIGKEKRIAGMMDRQNDG